MVYQANGGGLVWDQVITPVGKKTFLKMPRLGVVTLKSFESDMEHVSACQNSNTITVNFLREL